MMSGDSPYRSELEEAWRAFKDLPFPWAVDDDEMNALRADLAGYDSGLAGWVTSLLAGRQVPPDAFAPPRALRARLEAAGAGSGAAVLLEYLEKLEQIARLSSRLRA